MATNTLNFKLKTPMQRRVSAIVNLRAMKCFKNLREVEINYWDGEGVKQQVKLSGLEFADFNDADQEDAIKNWQEVTKVGYDKTWIPLKKIIYIKIYE